MVTLLQDLPSPFTPNPGQPIKVAGLSGWVVSVTAVGHRDLIAPGPTEQHRETPIPIPIDDRRLSSHRCGYSQHRPEEWGEALWAPTTLYLFQEGPSETTIVWLQQSVHLKDCGFVFSAGLLFRMWSCHASFSLLGVVTKVNSHFGS